MTARGGSPATAGRWAVPLVAATVGFNLAVTVRFAWQLHHLAAGLAVVSAGVVVGAVVAARRSAHVVAAGALRAVAAAALAVQVALWVVVFVVRTAPPTEQPLRLGVAVVGVLLQLAASWDLLRPVPAWGRWAGRVLVVATAVVAGACSIGRFTTIDVLMFQEVATDRLLSGVNPYLPGYPLVYEPDAAGFFYGSDLVEDGSLAFGFPYPPVSLLLVVPGALFGDVRLAHVAAVAATTWLLLAVGHGRLEARVGAVLFAWTPTLVLVTLRSWTECFLVLALAALVWGHQRGGAVRDLLFGVFLAVKQYALGLLPLYLLLRRSRWRSRATGVGVARAVATAAVLTLPWALWDPGAFWRSLGELLVLLPFRPDSLSLLAASVELLGWPPPAWHTPIGVGAAGVAILVVLWCAPRTASGFAAAVGLVLAVLFLLSKQAFGNYYFVVTGALTVAVAAAGVATGGPDPSPGRRSAAWGQPSRKP